MHTTRPTLFAGFGFKVAGSPSLTTDFFRLCDGAYYGISYHSKPGIGLRLASGAGGTYEIAVGVYLANGTWSLLGTTSGAGIQLSNPTARQDSWKYIELKVICGSTDGGTDGAVEVRVEETTVLSLTGVATHYRPQDCTDYFHLYYTCIGFANPGNGGANVAWIDDIYVLDDTGGDNDHKTYLGKQHVSLALPTGNGDHNDWTPNFSGHAEDQLAVRLRRVSLWRRLHQLRRRGRQLRQAGRLRLRRSAATVGRDRRADRDGHVLREPAQSDSKLQLLFSGEAWHDGIDRTGGGDKQPR